jgi:hypothetical protein
MAVDPEAEWLVEHLLVPIGGRVEQAERISLAELPAARLGVPRRGAGVSGSEFATLSTGAPGGTRTLTLGFEG